jgi:hypothetical protein
MPTSNYNCIAWAAADDQRFWWPTPYSYWPAGAPREVNLESFETAYATMGYLACDDGTLESGFEKIAIFADSDGKPTHAARQLPDGFWTSKLGHSVDIRHELHALAGSNYGTVVKFLKRPT